MVENVAMRRHWNEFVKKLYISLNVKVKVTEIHMDRYCYPYM